MDPPDKADLVARGLWCPHHGDKRVAMLPHGPLIFCRWCMRMRWGLPEPRPADQVRADIRMVKDRYRKESGCSQGKHKVKGASAPFTPDSSRVGFPGYRLSNLGATIRKYRKRLESLQ